MNRSNKKKLACALQAMCLGGGLLAADPAAVCEAATITTTQTYNNQGATITDDINITDGYISVHSTEPLADVTLTGQNIYINQGSNAYALLASAAKTGCGNGGTSRIYINQNGNSTVQIIGNLQTKRPDGSGSTGIDLYLTNAESYLAGMPDRQNGVVLVHVNNGANWYIPENVSTFTGTIDGGNSVSFDGGNIDLYHTLPGAVRSAAAGTRTFNATGLNNISDATLRWNGANFVLSSDIQNNLTDKVVLTNVTGNPAMVGGIPGYTNNYYLQIAYDPAMSKDGTYTASDLTILTTDNTGDTVTAKDYLTTRTEAAGLKTVNIKLTPTLSTNGGVTKLTALTVKNTDSDGPAAIMAGASSAAQLGALGAWRAENNDLQRRLGDLRWDEGDAGAWARAYGGKSQIHSDAGADVSYHGLQVGYDRARTLGGGKLFTGFALSNMKGDASGSAGKSDLDSKLFGVYGSYLGKRGHFIDAIIKYGRLTNDTTRTYDGVSYAGDYDTNGLNMSLEYGYHKQLHNGFYLEPQAELNYSHLNNSSYTMTANGTAGAVVRNNSIDSLIGRIGINAGRKTKDGNVYLKLSCLHEFNGDTGMTASYSGTTVSRSSSGSDTWLEYGIGFNQRIGKSQNLYGEVTRTAGADKLSDSWKANLGWRNSF